MSKSKGKQPAGPNPPPLPNPSAGSANPSASFSALWGYLQPALQHIMRSPTNDTRAPAIDVSYHMGVHTATYNYFTAQSESASAQSRGGATDKGKVTPSGTDLYEHLDAYYTEIAREALFGAPQDDTTLIHYLVPCFKRYSAGAHSINRLLNYVNRHYVKRAVDEDRGWLRVNDVLDAVIKTIKEDDTREKISKRLKDRRADELRKWGYDEGDPDSLAKSEACAEAASALDRVVPLSSLALRRFRTECVEPLLAVPKMKGKGKAKNKKPPPVNGERPLGPKGRLARAVKELLESMEGEEDERRRLAAELAETLKTVGVRPDHPLRKKLDKFVASTI